MIKRTYLLLHALLFALIINSPFIYQHISSPEKAALLFTDIDEVTYLKLAYDTAAKKPFYAYYKETTSLFSFANGGPPVLLDFITGKVGLALNLSLTQFGLLLDIVSVFLSYIAFYFLFALFFTSQLLITISVIIVLFFPWVFSPFWNLFPADIFSAWSVVSTPYGTHSLPPVFRGIYTQMSYPLVGCCLYLLLKYLNTEQKKYRNLVLCATLAGLSFLTYFFAWGSLSVVIPLTLFFFRIRSYIHTRSSKEITTGIYELGIFFFTLLLSSAPALYLLFSSSTEGIAQLSGFSKYWYLPLTSIYFLVVLLILSYFAPRTKEFFSLIFLLASLLLAEIPLMNLQPALSSVFASYHFPVLYLQPLFLSFLWVFVVKLLVTRFGISIKFIKGICILILLTVPLKLFSIHAKTSKSLEDTSVLSETLLVINKITPTDSVIAVLPYSAPFSQSVPEQFSIRVLPNLVYAVTDRYILLQEWDMSENIDRLYDQRLRERLLHYLLTKQDGFILPILSHPPELPGDTFTLTWTAYLIGRFKTFESYPDLQETPSLDTIKNIYHVDYLLVDKNDSIPILNNKPENYIEEFNNSRYILYRIVNL